MNADPLVDNILNGLRGDPTNAEESTWRPVDLTDALNGADVPAPDLLARTDGLNLLYRGRVHWFQGESESLKSWAAQVATAQVLEQRGRVLYLDFEDDERGVVGRLRALGVAVDAIEAGLVYLRPDEPLYDHHGKSTPGALDFEDVLDASYDLAVVDGVTEAMTTEGLELNSNADVAMWLRRLPKRVAAATGAAVVVIDHVTKSSDGRGRYALGGQHKLAGVTGAAYTFTTLRPFSRATVEPVTGTVAVVVVKDRPGHIRGRTFEGKVATFELTSYPDGGVSAALVPTTAASAPDLALVLRILDYLATYDGSSGRKVEESVEGKTDGIRAALKWMAADERAWVQVEIKGRSHLHWLTDEGRAQL